MKKMKLNDIIIQESFAASKPAHRKLCRCRWNWLYCGGQDRKIVVTEDKILIDGYVMYLVLKEFGEEEAYVNCVNLKDYKNYK